MIQQVNAHVGLVFAPMATPAGGADDVVYVYGKTPGSSSEGQAVPGFLGAVDADSARAYHAGVGFSWVRPTASGLGISADGKTLVVVVNYNDSISVIDTTTRRVCYEHDLRPFANNEGTDGVAGGTFHSPSS